MPTQPLPDGRGSEPEAAAPDLAALVETALREAAAKPPRPVELNRARALATADVRRRFARFHDRAIEFARYEAVGGDLLLACFALDQPGAVWAGDVQAAAQMLLDARSVWIRGTSAEPAKELRPALTVGHSELGDVLALPDLEPIEQPLAVVTGELDGGAEVRACRLPGTVEACVQIYLGPDLEIEAAQRAALADALESDPGLADYLSYHGIDLAVNRVGVRALGPPDRWDSMLEVAAKVVQRATKREDWPAETVGPVRVGIVCEEVPARVIEIVRQHESDWWLPTTRKAVAERPSTAGNGDPPSPTRVMLDGAAAICPRLVAIDDLDTLMPVADTDPRN